MKPVIDQAFWSDPDIERQTPDVKLAALWLMTNSQTSLLGICGASEQRFTFETSLSVGVLQRALEALPRAFGRVGDVVFIRNYIRYQFGSGEKLTRNNFFVALKSLFLSVKDEALKAVILKEYPEMKQALKGLAKGLQSPSKDKISKDKKAEADEEFIQKLEANDGYKGIDIRRELGRMDAWLLTPKARGRRKTRAFVVAWLNKCDATMPAQRKPSGTEGMRPV